MKVKDIQIGDLYYQKWQSKPGEWYLITKLGRDKKTVGDQSPTWWWTGYNLTTLQTFVVVHGFPEDEILPLTTLGRIKSIWRNGEKLL